MNYQADDRRHVEACVQQVFQKGFALEIDASHTHDPAGFVGLKHGRR